MSITLAIVSKHVAIHWNCRLTDCKEKYLEMKV